MIKIGAYMGYFYLLIAIIGEVIATTYLKSTNNFTEIIPSTYVVIGYGTAFYFMMLAMKTIPIALFFRILFAKAIPAATGTIPPCTPFEKKFFLQRC